MCRYINNKYKPIYINQNNISIDNLINNNSHSNDNDS
jgi:hypothetical protein